MKLIPISGKLGAGMSALVDDDLYKKLSQRKWRLHDSGYAVRMQYLGGGRANRKYKRIWMHREVARTPEGMDTDHRDHNKLNNQSSNLRVCTTSENLRNVAMWSNNTSGHKGVSWHSRNQKWQARIMLHGRSINLGYYDNKTIASSSYDFASQIYHGQFGALNG